MRFAGKGKTRLFGCIRAHVDLRFPTVRGAVLAFAAVLALIELAVPVHGQECPYTQAYFLEGTGYRGGSYFGRSVSSAGDVNNDGYDDVIVGVPDFGGTEGVPSDAGRAYVFSGLDRTILHTWNGETADSRFGYSVSGAGDVNNDGYADVIVGAYYYSVGTGRAYIFSGLDGSELYTIDGDAMGDGFGYSVSGAGDVNHDGYDDFIVGAPWNDDSASDCGKAIVYSGQSGSSIRTITIGSADALLGYSVAGIGDADNDGWADFAVGVPGLNGGTGKVYVYSGQGGVLATPSGETAGDDFGHSVSGAGDVNHDGYDDIIVGAPYYNGGAGRAYLYSVHDGAVLHTIDHVGAGDYFGHAVSGIRNCFSSDYTTGDVDGDGCDDVIVGAMGTELAEVYSGQAGALLCTWTGDQTGDAYGWSVSGAGDVDNDGFPDVIVGAYLHDAAYTDEGRAYVFTNAPELLPAVSSWGAAILVVLIVASGVFPIMKRRRRVTPLA